MRRRRSSSRTARRSGSSRASGRAMAAGSSGWRVRSAAARCSSTATARAAASSCLSAAFGILVTAARRASKRCTASPCSRPSCSSTDDAAPSMAIQPTFLLIADIGGYTRFMKFHRASLAHAQEIVAQLLEAVIDATREHLKLAKLEGDAAFFYFAWPTGTEPNLEFVAEQAATIYRAFHARASDLKINTLCVCDGCQQAGNLKIKLVGHFGGVAMQKVKQLTELAGVDVIVVHRMLKNSVPIPEYLLMTEPVHAMLDPALRDRAAPLRLELDDIGPTAAYYLDLTDAIGAPPPPRKLSPLARLGRHLSLAVRTLPYELGLRKACSGYRNVP